MLTKAEALKWEPGPKAFRKKILHLQKTGNSIFYKLFQEVYFLKGGRSLKPPLTQASRQVQNEGQDTDEHGPQKHQVLIE